MTVRFVCNRCRSFVSYAKDDREPFCATCGLWMRDIWHGETEDHAAKIATALDSGKKHPSELWRELCEQWGTLTEELNRPIRAPRASLVHSDLVAEVDRQICTAILPREYVPTIVTPIGYELDPEVK